MTIPQVPSHSRGSTRPRVAFVGMSDSPLLQEVLAAEVDVVGIARSLPRGSSGLVHAARRPGKLEQIVRERFYGGDLQHRATSVGAAYLELGTSNGDEFVHWLGELDIDYLLVCSMSRLLSREAIEKPKVGCINVHPSYLPEYRGPDPYTAAILDDANSGGVTLHWIDEGEDTGPIISQARFAIHRGMTKREMVAQVENSTGATLLSVLLRGIATGDAPPSQVQPLVSPTARAARLSPSEISERIQWEGWDVERLWHVLRGLEDLAPKILDLAETSTRRWRVTSYSSHPSDSGGVRIESSHRTARVVTPHGSVFLKSSRMPLHSIVRVGVERVARRLRSA